MNCLRPIAACICLLLAVPVAAAGRLYAPVPVAAPRADAPSGQLVLIGVGALDDLAPAVVAAFGAGLPAPVPRRLY